MAQLIDLDDDLDDARYEYRVWGKHAKTRKILSEIADSVSIERVDDCYFLVDEPELNVKVRDRTLKVKQLVERTKGFQRWASSRYRTVKAAPAPFDDALESLRRDRKKYGDDFDLAKAVAALDAEAAAKVVLVSKYRRRYRIGDMRAEVTELTIDKTGEVLRSIAIEGDDLDELVALRKKLRLKGNDNVAVHVALDDAG